MGPLNGFKIVEIAGIGPTQFTGMLLADMGAQIIRVGRPGGSDPNVEIPARFNLMNRSRPTIVVDLKRPAGAALVLRLCEQADALFEGFRPGAMERLGLGPDDCLAINPRLVYGRMTGWGQEGPLAQAAGHDANYIALAGVLASIGERGGEPVYPLNLIGDFGGGGVYLALGLLAALLETSRSGQGQVVDAAMVDGAASMMTVFYGLMAAGMWRQERGANVIDAGAPFVHVYRTKDDKHVVISPLEGRFYQELLARTSVDIDPGEQMNVQHWAAHEQKLKALFLTKSRDEWCDLLEGTDTCFAPVLSLSEATAHPHNVARGTYVEVDGIVQPGPAPRFNRTPAKIQDAPREPGQGTESSLLAWGVSEQEIQQLVGEGVVGLSSG